MSSLPNQATAPNPVQSGPVRRKGQKGAATEQVRKALHQHLLRTARFIKLMDTTVQVFAWIAAVLSLWLLACLIDHWLVALPVLARWTFWLVGVVGTSWWLTRYVLPLVFRRINLDYAALRIEHLVPEFKNGLISWLQLEGLPHQGVPRGVMAALAYRAKRFIGGQDPSATVDTSPLIKLVGVVLLLSTLLVVYTIVSPKSVGATAKRILFPWAALAAPTRVELLQIEPGDAVVTQGKPLPVVVEVRGLLADEPVWVRYSTSDGQLVDQSVALQAVTEGFKYAGSVSTAGDGVEHEFDYYVQAGDAEAGPFHVSLSPLPSVVLDSVSLEYPAYTRLSPRIVAGGKVEAPEGTIATILARANQSMRQGRVEVNPEVDDQQELVRAERLIDMQVDGRQLRASLRLLLNDAEENPTQVKYRIRGFNTRGDANPRPILHSLSVLGDMGPEITLIGPENRVLRVAPTSRVELEVQASDPDYGLAKIMLEVRRGGKLIGKTTLLDDPAGVIGRQVKTSRLNVQKLQLQAGDRIQILAIALDNRHDPQSGELASNRAVSEPLTLEVVEPNEPVDVPDQPPEQRGPTGDAAAPPKADDAAAPQDDANVSGDSGEKGSSESDGSQNADGSGGQDQTGSGQSSSNSQDASAGSEPQNGLQSSDAEASRQASDASGESGGGQSSSEQSNRGDSGQSATGATQTDAGNSAKPGTGQNSPGSQSQTASGSSSSSGQSANSQSDDKPDDAEVIDRVRRFMEEKSGQDPSSAQQPPSAGSEQSTGDQPGRSPIQPNEANAQPSAGSQDPGADSQSSDAQSSDAQSSDSQGADSQANGAQDADPAGEQDGNQAKPGESPGQESGAQAAKGAETADRSLGNQEETQGPSANQTEDQSNSSGEQQSLDEHRSEQSTGGDRAAGSQSDPSESQESPTASQGSQGSGNSDAAGGQDDAADNQNSQDPSSSQSDPSSRPGQENQGSQNQGSQSQGSQSQGSQSQGSQSQGSESQGSQSQGSQSQPGESSEEKPGGESAQEQGQPAEQASESGSSGESGSPSGSPQSSSSSAASGGQDSAGPPGQGPPSTQNQPGKQGGPGASTGGAQGGSGSGAAGDAGTGGEGADAVNQDYADRTTQMVLDELNRQRDQPDPELLKELNWTQQDLQEFVDRWNKARDLAVEGNEQDRLKWQEQLRDLGLERASQGARAGAGVNDTFQQMQDSGTRSRPPEGLRKSWEAFRRAIESR